MKYRYPYDAAQFKPNPHTGIRKAKEEELELDYAPTTNRYSRIVKDLVLLVLILLGLLSCIREPLMIKGT